MAINQTPTLKKISWRARVLMAERGVRSVTELAKLLGNVGVDISVSQLGRLIDGKSKLWNQEVIEGMMTVFDCGLSELFACT